MKNDCEFPLFYSSLLWHLLEEWQAAFSTQSPKELKLKALSRRADLFKQQQHKLNAHKGKKQCQSTLEGQGGSQNKVRGAEQAMILNTILKVCCPESALQMGIV